MITPRRTRLVRVPDLHHFRGASSSLVVDRDGAIVVLPTRAAARQLAPQVPHAICATRDELYEHLHARLATPPRRLDAIERDVIGQASARAAQAKQEDGAPDLRIRPGLIAEMIRFYDQLRRNGQQIDRFEALIADALGGDDTDRSAARMRQQTRFLAGTFREYERRVRDSGAVDEHLLRERLLAEAPADPVRQIVVTVADWIADPDGLYVADFDLLARIPGLERLDIVATERVLTSGFEERLHNWLPGIEAGQEGPDRPDGQDGKARPTRRSAPVLVTPTGAEPDAPWWTFRDREEELIASVRRIHATRGRTDATPLDRVAIVFKRPLPYLYLAPKLFGEAGLPYQTSAALPLAAEPTAAALDLVLDAAAAKFTRATLVALLRSPHFLFVDGGAEIPREAISAFDRALSSARYLGEPDKLTALAEAWEDRASEPALRAAATIVRDLAPLAESHLASEQLARLRTFWSSRIRPLPDEDSRERRARAAIDRLVAGLESAHTAAHNPPWTIDDLAVAVRRAIEEATFTADSDGTGIHLLDDQAARYGDFDDLTIVGLVETDWPERPRRNIFYPPALIRALGWPPEQERRAAADARFLDLLGAAALRTAVFTFTLDDDALVTRSVQLDEIPRARLSSVSDDVDVSAPLFLDETLTADNVGSVDSAGRAALSGPALEWLHLRQARPPADAPEFHGTLSERRTSQPWAVSALETYLECPFKFFARRVLKLEEEPDDEEVMDPRRQGQFVHEVFERFFTEWQEAGYGAITRQNLDAAREMFVAVVDRALEPLPVAEAGLERARLLGSPAAAGLGEAVFRMEAERPVGVVKRLLEEELRGSFTFTSTGGPRTISLRGKVDRIDLLDDGTFRLIDYKLGRAPNRSKALQLPIYSVCAEQQLPARHGRKWVLAEAAYLAFKGPRRVVPLFAQPGDRDKVLADAQQRLVDTVDAIERGEFPPTPEDVWLCEMCSFAAVCRKDYVGDV